MEFVTTPIVTAVKMVCILVFADQIIRVIYLTHYKTLSVRRVMNGAMAFVLIKRQISVKKEKLNRCQKQQQSHLQPHSRVLQRLQIAMTLNHQQLRLPIALVVLTLQI